MISFEVYGFPHSAYISHVRKEETLETRLYRETWMIWTDFIRNIRMISWKILIIVDNVLKGFSFIVYFTIVSLILIATFRPHSACLYQAILLIYWVELFVPLWLLVIGVSQTSLMVGGFRSIVRLSKSTLSPDEDLQCAVETSRSISKWQSWDKR